MPETSTHRQRELRDPAECEAASVGSGTSGSTGPMARRVADERPRGEVS